VTVARNILVGSGSSPPPHFRSVNAPAVTAAATLSTTQTIPAGVVNGDYLLAFVNFGLDTLGAAPGGWTLLQTGATGFRVYGKVAASEPATYTWTKTGTTYKWRVTTCAYSGCSGVDVSASLTSFSSTTLTWPTVTTAVANTLAVFAWGNGIVNPETSTDPSPTGATRRAIDNTTIGNNTRYQISDLAVASAGSYTPPTGSVLTPQGSNTVLVMLKP
jgi:hypothetical protein